MKEPTQYSIGQVGQVLDLKRDRIRELIDSGALQGTKLARGRLVARVALLIYLSTLEGDARTQAMSRLRELDHEIGLGQERRYTPSGWEGGA